LASGPTDREWAAICDSDLFAGLPEATVRELLRNARILVCARGRMLFMRGDRANRFFIVLDGWVKIFRDAPDGHQTVVGVMKPCEAFAQAAMFGGGDFPASAEVVSDARILEVPAEPFLTRLRDDVDVALKILASLSARLVHMVQHIEQIQWQSTDHRLAGFLLSLCAEGEQGAVRLKLPYDKSLVAARLGMQPESLSRAFAGLRKMGVSTDGPTVQIEDVAALRRYSDAKRGA
jgi:CRP-like cAMP-binding protein